MRTGFLSAFLLGGVLLGQTQEALFMAPQKVYHGSQTSAMVHAFVGSTAAPRQAAFTIAIAPGGGEERVLAQGQTDASGWARSNFAIPRDVAAGIYRLVARVEGVGDALEIPVTVVATPVLLIETDKPIYKPGQKIQARVISLNNALEPLEGPVTVEIRDAKQNKITRLVLATNPFGIAPFELQLANELNTGEWMLQARSGEATALQPVKVEPYVLPRFRLEVAFDKGWFLYDERIAGAVRSSYFFGKPVNGTVSMIASRLEGGEWTPFATFDGPIVDGEGRFDLNPVQFLLTETGEQVSRGAVSIEFVVTDSAGHAEKTKQLVQIVDAPFSVRILPRSPMAKPGLPYEVAIEVADPNGQPASRSVRVSMEAVDDDGGGGAVALEEKTVVAQGGTAHVAFTAPGGVEYLILDAEAAEGPYRSIARIYGPIAYSPTGNFVQLEALKPGPFSVGEEVEFDLVATRAGSTHYEVLAGGRSVLSGVADGDRLRFTATPAMAPAAKVVIYRIFPNMELASDTYSLDVRPSATVNLAASFDAAKVEPGDPVKLEISAGALSMVGVTIVDESVLALGQNRLDLPAVYREVMNRFGGPSASQQQSDFIERPHTLGCKDVLAEAGLALVVSGNGVTIPEGYQFFAGSKLRHGAYTLDALDNGGNLATVERVRQFFPETWVWQPTVMTDTAGRATLELTAPDSITNWKLRAVSTSGAGLGIASGDLVVFQDFFVEPDLPYAVTRGEEFSLPVAIYNYIDGAQSVALELEPNPGFEILGQSSVTVDVEANAVVGASFPIRAKEIGSFPFKLTARGQAKADALIRELRVEAEGLEQETVDNKALVAGETLVLDPSFPIDKVPGSERMILSICGSPVAQTIQGVQDLTGKPYG